MRILFIGMDRMLLQEGSAVAERFSHLGAQFPQHEFVHIVFSTRTHRVPDESSPAPNVHVYATQSRSRLFYVLDAVRIAKRLPRPDIITAQDPFETGFTAYRISRKLGIPYAVEMHTDVLSPQFRRHSFLNRIRRFVMPYVLRHSAGGYAVSARARDEVVAKYHLQQPFGVLPIYVDLDRFRSLPRTPRSGHLLWVGRFTPEKNPLLALRSFAAARRAGLADHLTLLGDGPLRPVILRAARRLGIDAHVSLPGWKDPAPFLPLTELLLVTSEYEGYGMALVEALAAGVPVLSTDVGIARAAGAVIAEGDYGQALCRWLAGTREAGILTLSLYRSEEEYSQEVIQLYSKIASSQARLLVITQAIDQDDPVLGFFHAWVEELATKFQRVQVICLTKGRYTLPQNVTVHSLGKERGRASSLVYIARFYKLLWKLRGQYEAVFVHMNEEYVLLAGPFWRAAGKRVGLWRNFHTGSWRTRLAIAFANVVFCTSRDSFTARFAKTRIMPLGIDTGEFAAPTGVTRVPNSILSFGRIAPVKRIDILIQALALLSERKVLFSADIHGDPLPKDQGYLRSLREQVSEAGLADQVHFHPGTPHAQAPAVFQSHEVFVNLSHSGMYDKTIFEAAAAGCLPAAATQDYIQVVDPLLGIKEASPTSLADQLEVLLSLPEGSKEKLRKQAAHLSQQQALSKLVDELAKELQKSI